MGCFNATQGHSAVPMELGEVSPDVGKNNDLHQIAEVRAQVAELSAFIKGGGRSGTPGQWSSYTPSGGKNSPGKGGAGAGNGTGKGKGKGKGGPSAIAVAWKRAESQPGKGGVPLCPEYQRTGRCTYFSRTGRECRFKHVKDVPQALSSIEGLLTTDLPSLSNNASWDEESHCFALACGECAPTGAAAPPVSGVEAEVFKAYSDLEAEMSFQILEPGPLGFQRHL